MKTIDKFELIDHGIEHDQYFQGCGAVFTSFENVVTGIGDNPTEAIGDCLEQIVQDGFETEGMEARIMEQEGWDTIPETPNVIEEDDLSDEWHCHVSIRWNEGKKET